MTPADGWSLAAAGVLVLVAAFCSAAHTALSRMSLPRALRLVEEGRRGATSLRTLMQSPARTLNIVALLAVVAQVVAVALVAVVAARHLVDGWAVAVTGVVAVIALFVGSEVAPKTVALQRTEAVACAVARPVALIARPLAPLASVLISLGNLLAPGKGLAQGPYVTEDELREMIDVAESDEVIESSERAMIHSIFELGDTVVREIMVPRPDMVAVSSNAPLDEVLDVILTAGHSRIPVYRGDRDKIVGLIYAKDVLRRLHTGDANGPWQELLRPPHFVPELKPVDGLLRELQAAKVHLAIVVDEYGATAGLVTIEDILEEIVGEIVDEYDREEIFVEALGDDAWRVDARLPVDELGDLVNAKLPDDEWDTVGGLLFGLIGHVPSPGEHHEVDGIRLTAEEVADRRIGKVLVERVAASPPDTEQ